MRRSIAPSDEFVGSLWVSPVYAWCSSAQLWCGIVSAFAYERNQSLGSDSAQSCLDYRVPQEGWNHGKEKDGAES
jgi:hypothetical protein